MSKISLNKNPHKRDLDGRESRIALEMRVRELEALQHDHTEHISLDRIRIVPSFQAIFPMKEEILHAIVESMRKEGFDISQPLLLWKDRYILVDGHTRLSAAKEVGLTQIPVIYKDFSDEGDVKRYIYALQFNRRNLTESDRLSFLMQYLREFPEKSQSGTKRAHLSSILNVSERTVQKYMNLVYTENSALRDKVISGEISLNQAYLLLDRREYVKKEKKDPESQKEFAFTKFLETVKKMNSETINALVPVVIELLKGLYKAQHVDKKTVKFLSDTLKKIKGV